MSMTTVPQLLGAAYSGVFRVSGRLDMGKLTALAKLKGLRTFRVDCRAAHGKRTMLAAIARGLHFPDYFGFNWDALADCLTDLEWLDADGIVVALIDSQGMATRAPRDLATALDVLQEAADYWAAEDVPFIVLVDAQGGPAAAMLPAVKTG